MNGMCELLKASKYKSMVDTWGRVDYVDIVMTRSRTMKAKWHVDLPDDGS